MPRRPAVPPFRRRAPSRAVRATLAAAACAALGTALGACAEPTAGPPARAASAPARSGAVVEQVPAGFVTIPDFRRRLVMTIGLQVTPAEFCAAAGISDLAPGRDHRVTTPGGALHIQAHVRDARLVVYDGLPRNYCDLGSAAAPVLAVGTGDFTSVENNAGGGGPGADRYHVSARGSATLVGGGSVRVQASDGYRVQPDGTVFDEGGSIVLTPR